MTFCEIQRTSVCTIGYQVEIAVETAAECPRLIAFAAEVDKSHARETWLDTFQSVCENVHSVVDQRSLRLRGQ